MQHKIQLLFKNR